jgi:hypothetical protein
MFIKILLFHKYKADNIFMILGLELFGATIGIGWATSKFENAISMGFILGDKFE